MKTKISKAVSDVVMAVYCDAGMKSATKYLASKGREAIVRCVRRGKTRANGSFDSVLKIGRPNYAEKKFINLCEKCGEQFPVKKVQLKMRKGGNG